MSKFDWTPYLRGTYGVIHMFNASVVGAGVVVIYQEWHRGAFISSGMCALAVALNIWLVRRERKLMGL